MTKIAAKEFGPHGIRANSIHPGVAVKPILVLLPERGAILSAAIAGTAVHRAGRPEDVSNAVHLLASDESPFINGVALVVACTKPCPVPVFHCTPIRAAVDLPSRQHLRSRPFLRGGLRFALPKGRSTVVTTATSREPIEHRLPGFSSNLPIAG
ncbi:TPA: SDR family oxidoreductase [Pseudomonas aeruginosa]|nr:SDR family oxidoreductase [Pseudomonas aeruginosa]HEH8432037.1 SDR family oxidoreductase [Pseudomonas aeruginosa]HEH8533588.1 SDR family oxidoreductase [Pseudomonas aeruginosa]HEH8759615.1 SDR family oxidoreductase [Pseudomonas aeruginosa]